MKSKIYEVIAVILLIQIQSAICLACGPDFPNAFLNEGDAAMLAPPVLSFEDELERMDLPAPHFPAKPPTNSYAEQSREADLADLRAALVIAHVPEAERETIVAAQGEARKNIEEFDWSKDGKTQPSPADDADAKTHTRPNPEAIKPPNGLPREFEEYFRGLIAYRQDKTNEARSHWEALLARPESERRFRSTWTAYMLGRSYDTNEPEKAIECYQRVRQLAKQGFPDSLGLAAASIGWEAQVNLGQKHFERALDLYLQQYAAGDSSATISLRWTARDALHADTNTLRALAKNPFSRRVITAFVIAYHSGGFDGVEEHDASFAPWLTALENADVQNVEEAQQLALAAYQNGQMELAQRWINRSLSAPTSQWLQAKLYLRAGKINRAAALLQHIAPLFPVEEPHNTNDASRASFEDNLYMSFFDFYPRERTVGSQVLGELGILHLTRREYRESLDCLLHADHWMDAAYVADRVLTVDELKSYVDKNWPPEKHEDSATNNSSSTDRISVRDEIRHLLARRLARLGRGPEARPYFPPEQQTNLDLFLSDWDAGHDPARSTNDQGHALFEAAKIARKSGMELFGTESSPDWHIHGGDFSYGVSGEDRTNAATTLIRPTQDELDRYESSSPTPDFRFHYRYTAASIAWQAAALLPNNSDETAKILWTAGCWLKGRDPENADVFYKSLVRRCRKTALGEEADRIRWFPELDESGKIIPGPTRRKEESEAPAPPSNETTTPVPEPPPQ